MTADIKQSPLDPFKLARKLTAPIWVYDIDGQYIAYANDAACALWGAEDEPSLQSRNMSADMSTTVDNRLKQYQVDFISVDAQFNETWTVYPNGDPVTIDVVYTGFPLPDGRMAMMCEVVSQTAQTTETLRSTQALLHTEVCIALFGIDGAPLYKNPAARALLPGASTTLEQLYLNPSDYAQCQQSWQESGESHNVTRVKTAAGEKWLDISIKKCLDSVSGDEALLVTAFDVSELKVMKAKSEIYQEQLEATFSTSLDGIIIIDSDIKILEFNASSCRIFGYDKQGVLGQNLIDLIIPQAFHSVLNKRLSRLRRAKRTAIIGKRFEIEALRATGETFISEIAISQSKSANGEIFIIYIRDISQAKAAEISLRDAKQAAEMASIAKSEFLATMSHEIRTPLNGVLGMIDVLRTTELSEVQTQCTEIIHQSGNNLLAIISDILDFSKLEAGKVTINLAPCHLEKTVKDVVDLLKVTAAEKKLSLDFSYDSSLPKQFMADDNRIKQIVSNLIGNAIKFTHNGGVSVSITGDIMTGNVRPSRAAISIAVQDTGIGIDESKLALIFEKFTQAESSTTRQYGGTGLGLAISKNLAESMDGDLAAASRIGQGATFTLRLPLEIVNPPAVQTPSTPRDISAPHGAAKLPPLPSACVKRKINFLIADENETNRRIFTSLLNHPLITLSFADSGQDAFQLCGIAAFDFIFIDASLAAESGVGLAADIRRLIAAQHDKSVPIIGLAPKAVLENPRLCREMEMDDYLLKPLAKDGIYKIIAKWMKQARSSTSGPRAMQEAPRRKRA